MLENVRLLLATYLEPRDEVQEKDGMLANCYAEQNPEGPMIVKRPGNLNEGSLGTTGQGAWWANGMNYYIADDTLVASVRFITMTTSIGIGSL